MRLINTLRSCILIFLFAFLNQADAQSLSWSASADVAPSASGNTRPRIALNSEGNPLLIWGNINQASLYFSRWNGNGFSPAVKLNPSWMQVATATWMGPDIAARGDTVYVVMKRIPENSDTNHIYLISSFNGGQTFSAPVRVDDIADSLSRFCTVTIDPQGHPMVAFMKFNSSFMDSRWVLARSNDYGQSFLPDVKASGWGNSSEVCDCCPGSVISSGNRTALLYRNNNNNIRDTWVGLSSDNGNSFSAGNNIDTKNWMIMSCPSTGPDAVISGDSLYSVFASAATGKYRVYFSRHSMSDNSLSSVKNLSLEISGLGQQNYPRIAQYGKAAAIAWRQSLNAKAELAFVFTEDIEKGLPQKYDTVKLLNVTNTDLAMSKDKIYVVWQDDQSGTVKYSYATYSQNNGIVKQEVKSINLYPNPVSAELYIELPSASSDLYVLNPLGQVIWSGKAAESIRLDVSEWAKGLYFLHYRNNNTVLHQNFLVE